MPRSTDLIGHVIAVEKGQEPNQDAAAGNGAPAMVDVWFLVFVDRQTGDRVRIGFGREVRDEVVRMLTGGIVLAGGELPRL